MALNTLPEPERTPVGKLLSINPDTENDAVNAEFVALYVLAKLAGVESTEVIDVAIIIFILYSRFFYI